MKLDIISGLLHKIEIVCENLVPAKLRKLVPVKYQKYLVPGLALILVLILCLACCSGGKTDAQNPVGTVVAEGLSIHKNPNSDSTILGQLPADLEIEILEEKPYNGGQWGRIEKMKLPDGTKTEAGWVDLQYVRMPGEEEPAPEISETEPPRRSRSL